MILEISENSIRLWGTVLDDIKGLKEFPKKAWLGFKRALHKQLNCFHIWTIAH